MNKYSIKMCNVELEVLLCLLLSHIAETERANCYSHDMCFANDDMSQCLCVGVFQERSGNNSFTHEALSLKYKLDNEFELIFVVSISRTYHNENT